MNTNLNSSLKLSGKNLANLMGAVLEKNADFRFQAKGRSMSPFIKNLDIVTISPLSINKPAVGDIVAVSFRGRKSVMVHRVIDKKQGKFLIKGDNNKSRDGVFKHDQIIGMVSRVERNGRRIWFGQGCCKRIIAMFSKIGLLNSIVLPALRNVRRSFPF